MNAVNNQNHNCNRIKCQTVSVSECMCIISQFSFINTYSPKVQRQRNKQHSEILENKTKTGTIQLAVHLHTDYCIFICTLYTIFDFKWSARKNENRWFWRITFFLRNSISIEWRRTQLKSLKGKKTRNNINKCTIQTTQIHIHKYYYTLCNKNQTNHSQTYKTKIERQTQSK